MSSSKSLSTLGLAKKSRLGHSASEAHDFDEASVVEFADEAFSNVSAEVAELVAGATYNRGDDKKRVKI